jgi:hypothetical protein
MRIGRHSFRTEQQPACQTLWQAVRNPLKSSERVKGTWRLKANSLKIKKIIFGQLCILYLYFVAPTLALGQPIGALGESPSVGAGAVCLL